MVDRKLLERLKSVDTQDLLGRNMQDFYNELGPKRLGLFADEKSFKLFILDYMVQAFNNNVEWPITYTSDEVQEEIHLNMDLDECLNND